MLPLAPMLIAPALPPVKIPPSLPPPPCVFSPTTTLPKKALNVEPERFIEPFKANAVLVVDWPIVNVDRATLVPRLKLPFAGIVTVPLERFPPTVNSLAVIVFVFPRVNEFPELLVLTEYPTRTELALIVLAPGKTSWPPTCPELEVPTQRSLSCPLKVVIPLRSNVFVKLLPGMSTRPTKTLPFNWAVPTFSVPPPLM